VATRILAPYPLPGLLREWRSFLEQAEEASAFHIGSEVLKALACEDSARVLYSDTWKGYERDHNGTSLCYGLCAALEELARASSCWSHIATCLDEQLKQDPDEDRRHLREASIHQFQRVSFLQFSVQGDVQDAAKVHKVLLSIAVLEEQEEKGEVHA
jgi:hypothetical protein